MAPPRTKESLEPTDLDLVQAAVSGDSEALEGLVVRHQAWIFNLALRMVGNHHDAEDVTQEILSKVVTRLATFEGRSKFRTWLYRIVVNHVTNMKRRPAERMHTFSSFARSIDGTPDLDLPDTESLPVDRELLIQETNHICFAGMLLCLNRKQRLAFILGPIFGLTDRTASEIIGISRAAYRKRLSRARERLRAFMSDRCALFDESNPCRCENKTRSLIESGLIDPSDLKFADTAAMTIRKIAPRRFSEFHRFWERRCDSVFRNEKFYEPEDFAKTIRDLTRRNEFKTLFDLN